MAKRKMKVLFVCSGNVDRSPTAEEMFRTRPGLEVKSAGTSILARRRLTKDMVDWADRIFVMEQEHADCVQSMQPSASAKVIVLHIPDVYRRNDPQLKTILRRIVTPRLEAPSEMKE